MLHLFMVLIGLVILGGFKQAESSGTKARHGFCHSYEVVKKFSLRDPANNDLCTLQIPTVVCGGFCHTETRMVLNSEADSSGTFHLTPVTDCRCCELTHQPRLLKFPPMSFTCLEGQKWNHTLPLSVPTSRECTCRTCTSSHVVE